MDVSFQYMVLETEHPNAKIIIIQADLTCFTKIYSKQINDLNVSTETMKLLEGNIGVNLHERRLSKGFLNDTKYATEEQNR